jgi:hypothetical protein
LMNKATSSFAAALRGVAGVPRALTGHFRTAAQLNDS